MNKEELLSELPENYNDLKKEAGRSSNWRARLEAVEGLGEIHHPQVVNILSRMMENDPVYTVQHAAYEKLKAFGYDVKAPTPNKPEPVKGLSKLLLRIKKSLPRDHSYEDFKEKFKKMRVDVYDTYEGEKGEGFDQWLMKQWEAAGQRPER
ncbi:HEAT repeat domain-containing protein [Paenibacillus pinistramenti]|uniref:HEAT repeat domain-containing protein n=1 Tax=Paenibacillus pinistramenti TaxID=1768003 RepID=UPI0011089ACD|nr:HEAT repeat domain-containing protein [Paenibacillus pinistramenti]